MNVSAFESDTMRTGARLQSSPRQAIAKLLSTRSSGWDMGNAERRFYMTNNKGRTIKRKADGIRESPAEYYSKHGILGEIEESPVELALDENLRQQIIQGKRLRRSLQNLSIKLDPAQITALKKIATMQSIPYQTLIRQWLAEGIRKELRLGLIIRHQKPILRAYWRALFRLNSANKHLPSANPDDPLMPIKLLHSYRERNK